MTFRTILEILGAIILVVGTLLVARRNPKITDEAQKLTDAAIAAIEKKPSK